MENFIYATLPFRVVFGAGALSSLGDEIGRLQCRRVLILSTPGQESDARDIARQLGPLQAGVFAGAVMHVPSDCVDRAMSALADSRADCILAYGGGSTIGLAKALALRCGLPIVAVPTTYAGSEVTPIYGITQDQVKRTGRDPVVLPKVVIYDPALTRGLPPDASVNSGLNAIAHAAEALYAHDGNPITGMMALSGIEALVKALPLIKADPLDVDARAQALYGAWLCGTVLGQVSMGLHHKLCHTLGGTFNLPHAETHAVMLPHVLAYNRAYIPAAMARIGAALGGGGGGDTALVLHQYAAALGAPLSLRELGMPEDGLDHAADLAVAAAYPNPRPLERTALRRLLQHAFNGDTPTTE